MKRMGIFELFLGALFLLLGFAVMFQMFAWAILWAIKIAFAMVFIIIGIRIIFRGRR